MATFRNSHFDRWLGKRVRRTFLRYGDVVVLAGLLIVIGGFWLAF